MTDHSRELRVGCSRVILARLVQTKPVWNPNIISSNRHDSRLVQFAQAEVAESR